MAGFFGSLGGGGRDQAGPTTRNNNKQAVVNGGGGDDERAGGGAGGNNLNLFSYGSEEIYHNNKGGFELWPTQYHPHHQQTLNYYAFGVDPSRRNNHNLGGEGNVSDDSSSGLRLNVLARQGSGAAAIGGSSGGGGMNCQDCGNQAKKDCPHLRCRTCCKSRGFQCQTHVKSTWVPAAKRRERQEQFSALQQQQQQLHQLPKRPREAAGGGEGGSSLACVRFPSNTSGLELAPFPAEVSSPAVFRCVRVSAMDDVEEQYAYQTAVNIGGHVFKGLLYDQGLDNYASTTTAGETSSGGQQEGGSGGGGGGHHHHNSNQQLNLIATTTTTSIPSANPPTATLLDPTVVFPTPLNAFVAGTQYFPPPR